MTIVKIIVENYQGYEVNALSSVLLSTRTYLPCPSLQSSDGKVVEAEVIKQWQCQYGIRKGEWTNFIDDELCNSNSNVPTRSIYLPIPQADKIDRPSTPTGGIKSAEDWHVVEFAGYFCIMDEPYYEAKNMLDAEHVGYDQAKENAELLVRLHNQFAGDGWKSVDGFENMPDGNWQVCLEKELAGNKVHSAYKNEKYGTIATSFHWDMPKVTHYKPLPQAPQNQTVNK